MDTCMQAVSKDTLFDTDARRERFATFVAGVLAAGDRASAIPYLDSPGEMYAYVVDGSNNWMVVFDKNDPRNVRLTYRYGDPALVEAATRLIAHLYGNVELHHHVEPYVPQPHVARVITSYPR
jgi:hypothetical protein